MGTHIRSVSNGFPSFLHVNRFASVEPAYGRFVVRQFRPCHNSHIVVASLFEEVRTSKAPIPAYCYIQIIHNFQVG